MAAELRSTAGSVRRAGGSHARHGGIGLAEMQRARLLAAALQVVDELGCEGASVLSITAKAGVSRRTFYELFENRDECLLAVFDGALERVTDELDAARLAGLPWRERVRAGLWRILSVFDDEPALARLPMRLTYRTARVLSDLAEHPRSNNREIATRVGVRDQGQISRLLARLQGLGLIANAASGAAAKGEPNVWSLTVIGEQVMYTIGAGQGAGRTARCGE